MSSQLKMKFNKCLIICAFLVSAAEAQFSFSSILNNFSPRSRSNSPLAYDCDVPINRGMNNGSIDKWPLVLDPHQLQFYIVIDNAIKLRRGAQIRLVCNGATNRFPVLSGVQNSIVITCDSGVTFNHNSFRWSFYDFHCMNVSSLKLKVLE